MESIILGASGFIVLFILIAGRFPIALAMLLVGVIGSAALEGWKPVLGKFYTDPYYLFSSHYLAVVPMFILMGHFAFHGGISYCLFNIANKWLGRRPGGVAMAVIGACAVFGSICGSSIATAATMGRIVLPEMKRLNYSNSLAAASVAVGGTLGTLIPPSIVLIIYALITEQNLVKLFLAALLPGIIAVIGYFITIIIIVRINPAVAPPIIRKKINLSSIKNTMPRDASVNLGDSKSALFTLLILIFVIGGIYWGFFTPGESAAIGSILTLIIAAADKKLGLNELIESIKATALTTGMIYMILLGAAFFSSFLALTQLPTFLATWIGDANLNPYVLLISILCLYIMLGCIMDSIAMLILTLPIFFPILLSLDFGISSEDMAIWFGILVLITVEMGLITPPIGLNLFVIKSLDKSVSSSQLFRGIVPFLLSDLIRIALLILFPSLTLSLVYWLG